MAHKKVKNDICCSKGIDPPNAISAEEASVKYVSKIYDKQYG